MELPSALESVLGALLKDHSITSWKVTSEGQNPTVVLRLKPVNDKQDCVSTHVYRRKPQSQVIRDRQRAAEHKQMLELRNVCISDESPVNPIGQEMSVNQLSLDASVTQTIHEKKDSVNVNSDIMCRSNVRDELNTPLQPQACSIESRPLSPVPVARAAGEGHTEMDTTTGDGGGDGSGGDGEREGTSGESDTSSDTESEFSDSEENTFSHKVLQKLDSMPETTRDFMKSLSIRHRNERFNKIVLDRRGPGVPRLLGQSDDFILTCDTGTGGTDFFVLWAPGREIKDLARCIDAWPAIDRGGTYSVWIEKMNVALTKSKTLVHEID